MIANVALLPGDGIGPEVCDGALQTLQAVAARFSHEFRVQTHLIGGAAIDAVGEPLPAATVEACRGADAVFLGAVGGPRWDSLPPARRPEKGLLALRRALGVFCNLRPARAWPACLRASPLRPEVVAGADVMIVRELTGGAYFGEPRGRDSAQGRRRAFETGSYDEHEIARVARLAFGIARHRRRKVCSVDKANVLETSRLWREVVCEVARDFPDVQLEHQLVDSAAMRLCFAPASFDVLLTENLFGDILSDQAACLPGTVGLLPSASVGAGGPGLFEPVHGSAPDIAGRDMANPAGAILSAAMMLRHGLGLEQEARCMEAAVEAVLAGGVHTADLRPAKAAGTREFAAAVVREIAG
ncbi:MAG: 3-isopropylmalate dehydrogenase [Planctomycetes bacterium]|nr:3-isopropylmalate dehydrogenase [Planctomycetota bacterium]